MGFVPNVIVNKRNGRTINLSQSTVSDKRGEWTSVVAAAVLILS